jgi:hypothetical protein
LVLTTSPSWTSALALVPTSITYNKTTQYWWHTTICHCAEPWPPHKHRWPGSTVTWNLFCSLGSYLDWWVHHSAHSLHTYHRLNSSIIHIVKWMVVIL